MWYDALEAGGGCVGVLGAGESGLGAAYLSRVKGFDVFLSDCGEVDEPRAKELESMGAQWEKGRHSLARLAEGAVVVKSPGIPGDASVVLALREKGVPVISEIEFANHYTGAK